MSEPQLRSSSPRNSREGVVWGVALGCLAALLLHLLLPSLAPVLSWEWYWPYLRRAINTVPLLGAVGGFLLGRSRTQRKLRCLGLATLGWVIGMGALLLLFAT